MKLDDLKIKGGAVAVRHADVQRTSTVLQKLGTIYDQHAKLVFLFDVSGSMNTALARSYTEQYVWTPEVFAAARAKAAEAIAKAEALGPLAVMGLTEDDVKLLRLADKDEATGSYAVTADDEKLKELIVRADAIGLLGVHVDFAKHTEKPPTRMKVVKDLAQSELKARYQKYPKSRLAVIPFGSQPVVMFDDGNPDDLWKELEKLDEGYAGAGWGTDIMAALYKAMDVCRAKPSPVGVHHFIVVSDGEDSRTASELPGWLPTLKASGVILDYIHIGDCLQNQALLDVARATGGDAVVVTSERDLRAKFVEAVTRLMLPPGK